MQPTTRPRTLTIDEKRAAEAAFKGLPFDSRWSPSARAVYDGIRGALGVPAPSEQEPTTEHIETHATPEPQPAETESETSAPMLTREEAIQAGYLIDVTPIAQSVGLPVTVCFSKQLWDSVITASHTLPDEQHESRVREVLVALQLRLATIRVASPAIEFPALLPFPPEPVPQLCLLFAIAMGDQAVPYSLTILLANEVSAIIRPTGN
jgi:hypothetical protein